MPPMRTRPMRRWLAALSVALAVPSAGHAIIGGTEDTSGLFPGVASLTGPTTSASAVLISPDWALTAAHVVCEGAGCDPAAAAFTLHFDFPGGPATRGIGAIVVKDGYAGFAAGTDGIVHNDLALLRLATPAPVAGYAVAPMLFGDAVVLAGYGGSGPFGGPLVAGDPAHRFFGGNVIDQSFGLPETAGQPVAFDAYGFDVAADGTSGAQLAGGDSGGAALVARSGSYVLAGINTFTFTAPIPGGAEIHGGGGMVLAAYSSWIGQVTAVPEPATWATLALGFAVLVVLRAGRSTQEKRSPCWK